MLTFKPSTAILEQNIENQSIAKSKSTSNLESNATGSRFAQIVQQRLKELATIHPQEQYLAQLQACRNGFADPKAAYPVLAINFLRIIN